MNITGKTKAFGIFGNPIEHTFSPFMHNAAFEKLKMDCVYLPFEVKPELLKDAVYAIRALGLGGVNVTVPFKETVTKYLDELSQQAKLIGAVNTIVNDNGKLTGHNTDGKGFVMSLRRDLGFEPKGRSAFVLGAGGAARSITVELAIEGMRDIYIVDQLKERSQKVASNLGRNFNRLRVKVVPYNAREMERTIADSDILINATPVGMKRTDPLQINPKSFHAKLAVYDLVYNPAVTKLMSAAKARRLKASNGLGMLLYQGAIAFTLWTKRPAPVDVMRKALIKAMGRPKGDPRPRG